MSDFPTYTSQANAPGGISVTATPLKPIETGGAPDFSGMGAEWKALAHLGHELVTTGAKVQKAQDETRSAQARTEYFTTLEEMRARYEKDPDTATAAKRFQEEARQLEDPLLENISEDHTREAARLSMRTHALTLERRISLLSAQREAYANDELLKQRRAQTVVAASEAVTPVERQLYNNQFDNDVDRQTVVGWISPQAATVHKALFKSDLATTDVQKITQHNAGLAIDLLEDPDKFRELAPGKRVQLIEAARTEERRQQAEAEAGPEREGFASLYQGTLDAGWLAENRSKMPEASYQRLLGALDVKPPPVPNAQVYGSLLDEAVDDNSGAVGKAADALRAGTIDKPTFQRVYESAQRVDAEVAQKPWALDIRRDMIAKLKPTDLQDPDAARNQLDTVADFNKWLDANPDAGPNAARDVADDLVSQARAKSAARERQTLPLPKFSLVGRDAFNAEALAKSAGVLRDRRDVLSEDEFVAQVDLLRRWHDVIQREAKPASPGGR